MRDHLRQAPDLPLFGTRVLGLFLCVRLTLTYLCNHLPLQLRADVHGVSQTNVSRAIAAYAPDQPHPQRSGTSRGRPGPTDGRRHPVNNGVGPIILNYTPASARIPG